jgi:hypothetical protein
MVHPSFTKEQAFSIHMQQHVSATLLQQVEAAFSNSPCFSSFVVGGMFSAVAFESQNP